MSSAKREQPTVLRWDDVVELVRRGNVAPPRRVTSPFPQKGRPAGAHADVGAGQSANLVSHTSAAKLLRRLGVGRLGDRGTSAGMGSGARAAVVIVGRWHRFWRVGDISMSIADFVRMHAAGFEEGGSPP